MENKVNIKKVVLAKCKAKVAESIATTSKLLQDSIASMHGETKSSAGDKFETSRAMLQAEQDRLKTILIKAKELEHKLAVIPATILESVKVGSIVKTQTANYFLSVGLGKVKVDELLYYVISPASPIGQLIMGKNAGDSFTFNKKTNVITDVY